MIGPGLRLLENRPHHHEAIATFWHAGLAVLLSLLAGGAWVGFIYHQASRNWIPIRRR